MSRNSLANSNSKTQDNTQPNNNSVKPNFFVHFFLSIVLAFLGFFAIGIDGYCAGGDFCRKAPSIIAFVGSFLMASGVVTFITAIRHKWIKKTIIWILIPALTIAIFLIVLAYYYNIIYPLRRHL